MKPISREAIVQAHKGSHSSSSSSSNSNAAFSGAAARIAATKAAQAADPSYAAAMAAAGGKKGRMDPSELRRRLLNMLGEGQRMTVREINAELFQSEDHLKGVRAYMQT